MLRLAHRSSSSSHLRAQVRSCWSIDSRRGFSGSNGGKKGKAHLTKPPTREEFPPPERHEAVFVLGNGATITKRMFKANIRPKLELGSDITTNRLWMSERAKRIQAEKLLQKNDRASSD